MLVKNTPSTRNNWLTDCIGLILIILLFYTLWLGSYPLFTPDEGRYSEVAREMIATGDYITPRVDGVAFLDKPILYYWLQTVAIHLFGLKEWALRLFPVLAGTLGCIMTYVSGRQLFNRRTGLLSAIILATTPLYFGCTHYANLDLEVAVFISSTLLCFIVGAQTPAPTNRYFLFAAYAFAAMAFLTKGLIGLAFPCMIAGMWIVLLWRWKLLTKIHLIPGLLLFIALVLPWYLLVQKANPEFLHFFFVTQQVTRFLSNATFNNPTPFWFYLPVVMIGFFPWISFTLPALVNSVRHVWRDRQQHAVELFLLLWLAIIFTFFSIPHSKMVSYILPVFPALALLVGNYLSLQWEHAKRCTTILSFITFIIFITLLVTLLIALPTRQWFNASPSFYPYLATFAGIFILGAIAQLGCLRQKTLLATFSICTACSALFLITLTLSATHLNQNTAKPLTITLNKILQPQDEVVHYYKFYQDVPLYLQRQVTIVADWQAPDIAERDNWLRELWYGMPFQKTDAWLISENTFWERWSGNKRLFVFLNKNYFDQFKTHVANYFVVDTYNDIVLVSNRSSH